MEIQNYSDFFKASSINFNKKPAIINYEENSFKVYTYEKLNEISVNLLKCYFVNVKKDQIIGILLPKCPLIPIIVNLIHECKCGFIFLNPEHKEDVNCDIIKYLNISIIISNINPTYKGFTTDCDLSKCTIDLNMRLFIWKNDTVCLTSDKPNISYCIRTSGSTGKPKYVTVPHKCIQPNISNFESIFSIKDDDIIYFSTPLTFDPSIIELYLAAKCGASLLIAPQNVNLIFSQEFSITIWQTTPSKFSMLGTDIIKDKVLNEHSKLRILALGGEPLNFNFKTKHINNQTEIYNLYGITEVSCWATFYKINDFESNEHFNLGEIMSNTSVKVFNNDHKHVTNEIGSIFIGSSDRVCLINNESLKYEDGIVIDGKIWRDTGDMGIDINNKIVFKGRKDKIIKRFGHKINLLSIETILMKSNNVNQCVCLWEPIENMLSLYYSSKSFDEKYILEYLKKSLNVYSLPDNVIRLESLPTNDHGKIALDTISSIHLNFYNDSSKKSNIKDIFIKSLNHMFHHENFDDRSYINMGGTSIMAVQLINKLKNTYNKPFTDLYTLLLDPQYPLNKIIKDLDNDNNFELFKHSSIKRSSEINGDNKRIKIENLDEFAISIVWKYCMKKCIDSNPTLYTNQKDSYIIIGSHSGQVAILESKSGVLLFNFDAKSRVEAPVLCYEHNINVLCAVGCYDGSFYCFSLSEKKILWKTQLKAMIKSQALYHNQHLFVATYEGILYKLNLNGEIINCVQVSNKGITADLVSCESFIFIATLDGTCAKVDCESLFILWSHKLDSPIFAKPTLIKKNTQILFNEVNSNIHCLDVENGSEIWIFDNLHGPVFSSCSVRSDDIFLGCHDRHLYKVRVQNERPNLEWKSKHRSEVFSTPCLYSDSCVVSVSTDGYLYIIDMLSGGVMSEFAIPGEVFSSPVVCNDLIFIGCRDDYVYCLQIKNKIK